MACFEVLIFISATVPSFFFTFKGRDKDYFNCRKSVKKEGGKKENGRKEEEGGRSGRKGERKKGEKKRVEE